MRGAIETQHADVLIIGGGIVGLSVAWQFSRLGVDRVVVLEAGAPGFKSTGQSSGGIRRQFATRLEIEMTLASLAFFDHLLADPGFQGEFNQVGYAFLAGPEHVTALERALSLQRELGIDARWIEQAELSDRFPYIAAEGVVGGAYCPDDGFIEPWAVVAWLVKACRAAGVSIREWCPVEEILVVDRRVRGARAGNLTVAADIVVNAAGAWAGRVGELAGAMIPVSPSPRVKYVTDPHPALPADMPLIIDLPTGAYVRSDRGSAMIGVKPPRAEMSFTVDVAADHLSWMMERAAIRFPSLRGAPIASLVTGLYEVTPDGLPVAGAVPGLAGFHVIAGFNGHGIMHGPAVARALAEEIASGRAAVLDLAALRPGRFLEENVARTTEEEALL